MSMEKLNTIQKRNNLNEVYRNDKPGAGGACHVYVICHRVFPVGEKERVVPIAEIVFQHGPRNEEDSATGILDADLLEIVRDRLKAFQTGEYATRENACAITHIEEALMWMNKRAEDRAERGVLGTMQK
nr:MAG TPA: hypothetical protein [Caudoviricetes sp.]